MLTLMRRNVRFMTCVVRLKRLTLLVTIMFVKALTLPWTDGWNLILLGKIVSLDETKCHAEESDKYCKS